MAQMRAVVAVRPDGPDGLVVREVGEMGRAFDGGYAEYALVPEHQLITLDTTLPWDVLGALPDGAVDLIGGPGVLETLRLLRPGATACNSGSLSDSWVIPNEATGKLVVLPHGSTTFVPDRQEAEI